MLHYCFWKVDINLCGYQSVDLYYLGSNGNEVHYSIQAWIWRKEILKIYVDIKMRMYVCVCVGGGGHEEIK